MALLTLNACPSLLGVSLTPITATDLDASIYPRPKSVSATSHVSEDLILPLSPYRGRPSRQLSPDIPRKPAHSETNVRNDSYVGGSVPKTTRTS